MKKIKINDNTNKKVIIAISCVFIIIIGIIILFNIIIKNKITKEVATVPIDSNSLATDNQIEWFTNEENNTIDIDDIIAKNLNESGKEELETEVVELEYETEYQNNDKLPKGMVKVLQQGQDGKQELIIKKEYKGDEEISNEQIGRKILTPCVNKIVEVGTAAYYDKRKITISKIFFIKISI